jgi:hypothetical protein
MLWETGIVVKFGGRPGMSDLKVMEFRRRGTPQEALDVVNQDLQAGAIKDIVIVWQDKNGHVWHNGSVMSIPNAIGLLEITKLELFDEMTAT